MEDRFIHYIKAKDPLIWVESYEENRVLLQYVAEIAAIDTDPKYRTYTWDMADGIREVKYTGTSMDIEDAIEGTNVEPLKALAWMDKSGPDNSVLFLKDYHAFLGDKYQGHIILRRKIRNLLRTFNDKNKSLVIISPVLDIPLELKKSVRVVQFALPTPEVLRKILKQTCTDNEGAYPDEDSRLIKAAQGMSAEQTSSALCLSLVMDNDFDVDRVRSEKAALIKTDNSLELVEDRIPLDDVGGMDTLKDTIITCRDSDTDAGKAYGIEPVKAILLAGPPGTGKTYMVQAIASAYDRTLLSWSPAEAHGMYVGQSEQNTRAALNQAEAQSPCILHIDEIEKALAGTNSGGTAHETTKHQEGMLLTWMQTRKSDVLVVATANEPWMMSPTMLRAGRFDFIFSVGFPEAAQRAEIFKIHLRKIGRDPNMFDKHLTELMAACDGFSGAEIQQWIKNALRLAFKRKHKDIQHGDLMDTLSTISPVSASMVNDIKMFKEWAKQAKAIPASTETLTKTVETITGKRKVVTPATPPPPSNPSLN